MTTAPAHPGRSWVFVICLWILPVLAVLGVSASESTADDQQDRWHVAVGDGVVDTLEVPYTEAWAAAVWVLGNTDWVVANKDPQAGRIVTSWKPCKHSLVRMVAGDARVRVAVKLSAVGAGRTAFLLQGGIATETSLEGKRVLGLAHKAGAHELRNYMRQVKERIAEERKVAAVGGGTARGTAAPLTR